MDSPLANKTIKVQINPTETLFGNALNTQRDKDYPNIKTFMKTLMRNSNINSNTNRNNNSNNNDIGKSKHNNNNKNISNSRNNENRESKSTISNAKGKHHTKQLRKENVMNTKNTQNPNNQTLLNKNPIQAPTTIEMPIRIKAISSDNRTGPKLKIVIGEAMTGGFSDPGTPPLIDLGSPEIRIQKAPYKKPQANDLDLKKPNAAGSNLEVNKNNLYQDENIKLTMGLGFKDFNALTIPEQHQKVANIVDWLQIYQDCMRFAVTCSLGVIDKIVQWNGAVVNDLAPAPTIPSSIDKPLQELQCIKESTQLSSDQNQKHNPSKSKKTTEQTEQPRLRFNHHDHDMSCISIMESEILNLERMRIGLHKTFEILASQLKQRFSEADDTFLLLEGLILSERAIMEWHQLWADANGARRADVRQATEHAIHALITSVIATIEGVRKNAETVLQEYTSYEESSQLIAPKSSASATANVESTEWNEIQILKNRYVQFLETKLCLKNASSDPNQNPCIILARVTRDVLNTVDPTELLPALRTGMQDIQIQLDKWALAVSNSKDPMLDGNISELDLEKSRRDLIDARAMRSKLVENLEKVDRELIQFWANTEWKQIKQMHEERNAIVVKLKDADDVVRGADAFVGTQLKKRIDAMKTAPTEVNSVNIQEIVMLSSEHRYNYLNELDNLSAQLHTVIYAQPKGLTDLYYRFQDIIQSETKQVLCRFRGLSTQKIYEQGNYWAQVYADNAHKLHEQWRNLEHFLRNQKSTLDDAVLQQKQRLVISFDITDEQLKKLLRTVREYEDTSFKLMEAKQRRSNVLALKGLLDRMLSIDIH